MHTAIQPGTLLEARGRPWILHAFVNHLDCSELHLDPALDYPAASGVGSVVLLTPFDRPISLAPPGRLRPVSRRGWMASLRRSILALREPGMLAAAASADVDLLPHQLEPALAVLRHGARRLLLADAVGLGKTIEAGLVLAELRARLGLDRALVLAPPGLCDQWCSELSGRFRLEAAVADAAWLRGLRQVLPASINPWSIPGVRVASLDFAKRPEVRRSVEQIRWDAVVIDEAHMAAGDSERRDAAQAFAARARFVLLLTATPHSGDWRTYHALCGIGALGGDDSLVMFRRGRAEAGLSQVRRVHLHRIPGAPAEHDVRRRLDDYVRAVWARRQGPEGRDARLAMIVLLKRSFSGMGPLHRSLVTRLDRLGAAPAADAVQLPFFWDGDVDDADAAPSALLGAPGFHDPSEERVLLRALAEGAALAEAGDSKRLALIRILRRIREPVIVFTEYRDTLTALREAIGADAAVLHGAMDRFERAAAVNRFTRGDARVLLATDAAGEGLNLHHRCRLVVNLELPWNPMRLEQRIGRVDRIGQARVVHAINLLARGTAEAGLLWRLTKRLVDARASVGAVDDVLGESEERVMAACLGLETGPGGLTARPASFRGGAGRQPPVQRLDSAAAARALAGRLELQRRLLRAAGGGKTAATARRVARHSGAIAVAAVRRSSLPMSRDRCGLLAVFTVRSPGPAGLPPCDELVPVFAACPCQRVSGRQDLRARAAAAMATLVPAMAAAIPPRDRQARQQPAPFDRDARIAARDVVRPAFQRGLFDRRAEREAHEGEAVAGALNRPAEIDRAAQPVLLLFLTP